MSVIAFTPSAGAAGFAVAVPLTIAAGSTFTVPANTQVLFEMTIDCEGVIDLEGVLVEVT